MIKTKGNLFNTDERNFNGLGSTQWKFKDFSATQILHEIIFLANLEYILHVYKIVALTILDTKLFHG